MDSERAELCWKWGVRGGLALLLLLANALLAALIFNASAAFDAIDKVGEAADALEATAGAMDALATELVDDAERVTSTLEQAEDDAGRAREALEQAGVDLDRAANDFERIADALEEAFAQ